MRRYCRIRSFLLAGLLAFVIPPSTARAVSISLVPDGSTTIEIGETVNVDVFMVLDAADQVAGIDAATLQLELGSGFVDVVGSSSGSVFPVAVVNVHAPKDFIAFSQFGVAVTSPTALLGSLSITGRAKGSYDLVGRRFGSFPLFTAPGDAVNRYDFASNEALVITVTCGAGACPIADPVPAEPTPPPPIVPDLPPEEPPEIAGLPANDPPPEILGPPATPPVNLTIMTILTTFTSTEMGTLASTLFGTPTSTTQVVPEPHTFALLGLALTGLMLLRSPRREPSKRSPGS